MHTRGSMGAACVWDSVGGSNRRQRGQGLPWDSRARWRRRGGPGGETAQGGDEVGGGTARMARARWPRWEDSTGKVRRHRVGDWWEMAGAGESVSHLPLNCEGRHKAKHTCVEHGNGWLKPKVTCQRYGIGAGRQIQHRTHTRRTRVAKPTGLPKPVNYPKCWSLLVWVQSNLMRQWLVW